METEDDFCIEAAARSVDVGIWFFPGIYFPLEVASAIGYLLAIFYFWTYATVLLFNKLTPEVPSQDYVIGIIEWEEVTTDLRGWSFKSSPLTLMLPWL